MKVATIGFFDGVHKGHQFLIRQVVEEAERMGTASMAVTFANHPRTVVEQMKGEGSEMKLLTTRDEKVAMLKKLGIQEVRMLEFTSEMALMTAREFMSRVLKQEMDVGVLVIGYDHRFGHNRSEGFDDYVRYGEEIGIKVIQAKVYEEADIIVSSSLIRETLQQGRIADCRRLLGYDYSIKGIVVNGFRVGRTIGYPTANVQVASDKLVPRDGVYAVKVEVPSHLSPLTSHCFDGMLNIGWRPTFNGNCHTIEVHLFDFDANIYSEQIVIHFIDFIRPEQKFDSPDALVCQLAEDEKKAKALLTAKL